jgi:tRNA dimethylallyltransferase
MKDKPVILVILGPTSSGKSDLAVTLAKKLNGEVVSADSRQIYKGLDIGTGKITKKEMKGVPHHLLDVASPLKNFSVDTFQKLAYEVIDDILKRGKLPILCGGTGFYIQAIVDGLVLPEVKINKNLREKLEPLPTDKIYQILYKFDQKRALTIDKNNRPRLIRALEIISALGVVPKIKLKPRYNSIQIGIKVDESILKERIHTRLEKRLKKGMLKEAETLHTDGLSWKRMESLGLEYRYMSYYLRKKISKEEMIRQIELVSLQYAKRQMTWFKRDQRIHWVHIQRPDSK